VRAAKRVLGTRLLNRLCLFRSSLGLTAVDGWMEKPSDAHARQRKPLHRFVKNVDFLSPDVFTSYDISGKTNKKTINQPSL